jgi:hypothetical protein
MTEELKIFPFGKDELLNIDKEDRKSYGSVLVQACKGSYGFEFYVRYLRLQQLSRALQSFFFSFSDIHVFFRNANGVRTDTEASTPSSVHYCLVYWNGEEIGRTISVQEEKESTYVTDHLRILRLCYIILISSCIVVG